MRKLKYILLFFFLAVFAGLKVWAQKTGQQKIDSLLQAASAMSHDTSKVKILSSIAFTYQNIDPNKGIQYGNEADNLAKTLGWKKGTALAYNAIGNNYRIKSDYSRALEYFFEALKINEELGELQMQAQNYGNIGIVYKTQAEYPKALEYYHKALKIFEDIGDKHGVTINLGNIGIVHESMGDLKKSLEYQMRALKINEETGNTRNVAHNLGNIGLVYNGMGDFNTALQYINRALTLNEKLGNKKSMANNYRAIGDVNHSIAANAANASQRSQAIGQAVANLNKGLTLATELGDLKNLLEMHELLSKVQTLAGNYKDALENYRLYTRYKDSIFNETNSEHIAELVTRRELDIRDRELQIQNKQLELDKLALAKDRNEQIFYIAGIIVLIAVVVYTIRSNRLLGREKEKSEKLLLNILPEEIAHELKETGSASARHFDDVTILFTDFVNFTIVGEQMGSQELVDELNTCFKEFDAICGKYNIEKIKTIGDAYLAVSGLPIPNDKHAEDIAHAAIEMRDFMLRRRETLGDKTFSIRIGINSGSVVAGIVGVKKFAYDIWGDTVNTAARMEQSSLPDKINISATTYELLRDQFQCTYRGEIAAKNKGQLDMYFLESARVATSELAV